jgi:hypothetical protein
MTTLAKEALLKVNGNVVRGTVTKEGIPNEAGYPLDVDVTTPDGTTHRRSTVREDIAILVPHDEIPAVWKSVMEEKDVAVCYESIAAAPIRTTLVCPKTMKRLEAKIETEESARVSLWEGDPNPSESKPSLEGTSVTYMVGDTIVELDEVTPYA